MRLSAVLVASKDFGIKGGWRKGGGEVKGEEGGGGGLG